MSQIIRQVLNIDNGELISSDETIAQIDKVMSNAETHNRSVSISNRAILLNYLFKYYINDLHIR